MAAVDAKASSADDQYAIWYRILNPGTRAAHVNFESFRKQMLAGNKSVANMSDFDRHVRQILAMPLLQIAIQEGDVEASLKFLSLDAKCNVVDLQRIFSFKGDLGAHLPLSMNFHGHKFTMSAPLIYVLARNGQVDEIQFLLQCRVDVNQRSQVMEMDTLVPHYIPWSLDNITPLHVAASYGHLASVRALLKASADVHAESTVGVTPLSHWPLRNPNRMAVNSALLDHKAGIGCSCLTALHIQAGLGNDPAVLTHLLSFGHSPNVYDRSGMTPLLYVVLPGFTELTQLLLNSRADANARVNEPTGDAPGLIDASRNAMPARASCMQPGATPLDIARKNEDNSIVDILLSHGATCDPMDIQV
eukprot:gnl/MRDRNA2_/MRDRNA2_146981_c0_seq1.p1 gnl/MRDRNA2_/MRDRNA2_146981_c0~~gnl/MRDRNA2_/MRDRNA2_146981_c0_seq1.p1  ORF type:complete len:423 (-),score=65.34 gnl/MRDRNA2_/MRDRNA2_146981_c0_seq1:202-1284(-)